MSKIEEAIEILAAMGLPKAQQNERSALCLLGLVDVREATEWRHAMSPLMGITPLMGFAREHYGRDYAPNTRETFRRQSMHQFVAAGVALYNPDDPARAVNSPKAVYQISPEALELIKSYGSAQWAAHLATYLERLPGLAERYARRREQAKIPVSTQQGQEFALSPGRHSELIKQIIEEFAQRFTPGALLVYAGDTGDKVGYYDEFIFDVLLQEELDKHGKMPDVILYYEEKDWLVLVEAVTSHGPVDAKRHEELSELFKSSRAGLVYVTAFLERKDLAKRVGEISWETEVWIAENPGHLIHFDGKRFLGPYE
jgi:hypothetical protein